MVEDIDMLQWSSSNSTGEDGSRDLTCEDYDDEGIPKSEPDLHEVEPEEAGALRWSLRKKPAPVGGRVRHSSEKYDDETEETGDPRWSVRKKSVPAGGRGSRSCRRSRMRRRGLIPAGVRGRRCCRRSRMRRRGLIPAGGRGRRRPVSSSNDEEDCTASKGDEEEHLVDPLKPVTCRICSRTCPTLRRLKAHRKAVHNKVTFPCSKCSQVYKTAFNKKRHKALCGKTPARASARGLQGRGEREPEAEEKEFEVRVRRVDVRLKRLHRSILSALHEG